MNPRPLVGTAAALLASSVSLFAAERVKVTGGLVEGTTGTDPAVRVYRGVPFAAPPVGALRWREPRPVTPWTGVRKADTWGTRCVQAAMWGMPLVTRDAGMGEDCLYLNVWTTAQPGEKRPVLFVIHGGGFAQGSSSEPRTDGEWFAKQGIVVVEPNYRLGVIGFMAHPELTRESNGKGSGNYGLLDQAAALEWVRANVAAFGGDPGNVTINGESAGSLSVSAHMASPLTKHLFHKAIGQSGAFFASPTGEMVERALTEKEKEGVGFAESLGAKSLAELRAKPAEELLKAMMARNGGWGWSPGLDGYFLTERAAVVYAAGRQAKVPLLAGWTSSELGMAVAFSPQKPTVASLGVELKKQFGDSRLAAATKAYAAADDAQAQQATADLASDFFIAYSTWKWMEVHAAQAPVYRYRFDRALDLPNGMNRFGAIHASDIEYSFATLDSKPDPWTTADRQASATFASAFANFVKTGTPNGPGVPEWPAFGSTRQVMYLDGASHAGPEQGRARYELIDHVATASPEQEVDRFQRELITALKAGDRPALERMIAEGFTFVHSTGGLDTRAEYIDDIVTAAQAGRAPDIERLENDVRFYDGHTAVTTSRAMVRGRGDDLLLRSTHVYVKRDGQWQWAGGQSTRLPNRPQAAVALPPAVRDSYAGRYEVGPGRILTVRAEGDALKAVLAPFREAELIARSETEFAWFNPDLNLDAQLVFVRDAGGGVTHAAFRRDGKEVWRAPRAR